jgi:putative transposon-encoded protein
MSIKEYPQSWFDSHAVTGTFEVTAANVAGTSTCQVEIPGRYAGKKITVVIYEPKETS